MAESKKYWKGIEELTNPEEVQKLSANEFASELPTTEFLGDQEKLEESSTSRRDFLKYMGFSTAAATLAACEAPIVESIPYVVAPEELIPGIPNYYATSYSDGHDYASILVKTREGRPIKIENNTMAAINGGANARVHASVLNLYDATRLQKPMIDGKEVSWSDLDAQLGKELAGAGGKEVVFLTSSIISPTTKKLIKEFGSKYTNFKHYTYDAYSYSGKLDAHMADSGKRSLPMYHFDKADVVVSFGADFLGDWTGQNVSGDYAKRRKPGKDMSRHIQFESNMSLTGGNADKRYKLKPSEMGAAMVALYNEVSGSSLKNNLPASMKEAVKAAAKELKKAGKNGLVVSGSNNADIETITIAINKALSNTGTTIDSDKRVYLRQGDDKAMNQLVADMNAGKVGALMMYQTNPVYRMANNQKFVDGLKKVKTTVAFTERNDETAQLCKYVCALHNYLESWDDAMPADGAYSLQQPVIRPLFDTRQMQDCLLFWSGSSSNYHNYLKDNWSNSVLSGSAWDKALHDGVYTPSNILVEEVVDAGSEDATAVVDLNASTEEDANVSSANGSASAAAASIAKAKSGSTEIEFYQMTGIGVGTLINNPWLLELPDPITRVTWDNYMTVSAADALEMGLENKAQSNGAINGSLVNLTANGTTLENVPVFIQPGQAKGSVGLAVGMGRQSSGKASDGVGVNAFALMNGQHTTDIKIEKVDGEHEFACTQLAHTMMGRKIVNETTLDKYLHTPAEEWNEKVTFETFKGPLTPDETNLWDDFDHETGHMWNMSIDLNLCNGCGACIIACHSENNVPVVGKEEVRKHRDMHWLRIDRYYSSDMNEEVANEEGLGGIEMYAKMEDASASPDVYFQPVMCQHCNHAPCETVCPVAATTHSAEGLNHMAYNRCIGTRYCANNCPYKVRRFNWFLYNDNPKKFGVNYAMNEDLGRMVLNPDVTVRTRGVMEKCSMCVQRIQLGKLDAKKRGQMLKDGEVKTACQTACDTDAIAFGDVNNKDSEVFKLKQDKRMYHLLEEVGTQPSVFYQTKVRNRA